MDPKDQTGTSPLHSAASAGHVDCIDLLVQNGEFVNVVDTSGVSPLHQVNIPFPFFIIFYFALVVGVFF